MTNDQNLQEEDFSPDTLKKKSVFSKIIDEIDHNIYITNAETDEILFMNQKMKDTFGVENPEGKRCWEVLQHNMTGRCEFCPLQILEADHPENSSCVWEETNTLTQKIFEHHDSLMRWFDGRLVHFQYSIDITENKTLSKAAYIDELTGILNDRAGKQKLEGIIELCYHDHIRASICMLDINDLKWISDTLSRNEGEHLVLKITQAIQELLGMDDCFFRLNDSEFVIIFLNHTPEQATEKMEQILQTLRQKNLFPDLHRKTEFCYGIVEISDKLKLPVDQVLRQATEVLYRRKRAVHIAQSFDKLEEGVIPLESDFKYEAEYLYEALANSTDDYIFINNMKTGVFRYSQRMVEEFALPGPVIKNAAAVLESLVHENDKRVFMESNQDIIEGRTTHHTVEYRARNRKGEWVWLRCCGHVARDEHGEPSIFAGFITNLGKKNRVDSITGLFNKLEFTNELERQLKTPFNHQPAVMLFGIDNFKRINTLYNHAFGDEVIRLVSQKISSMMPQDAAIFRMDSDQFGLIIRDGKQDFLQGFFEEIQREFSSQQALDDKNFFCTLSCGCVITQNEDTDYLSVLRKVSYALDYAKMKGKNQIVFYSEELMPDIFQSLSIVDLLRESIDHDFQYFDIDYQPIFSSECKIQGAEALCRWKNDTHGPIRPEIFIGLLEKNGMILQAGRWIFIQSIRFAQACLKRKPDFDLQINLSYLQLEDPLFFQFVQDTLREYNVPPERIILELAESYLAENINRSKQLLEKFRSIGVRIAMDDFGTGYSSLSVLKNVPLDIVKIDCCFAQNVLGNEYDRSFIQLVTKLCHTAGLLVCQEGIETEEQYQIIEPMEVDSFQGFWMGRPVPQEEFLSAFLPENRS